ncbi:hypothetical protein [Desertivibrio insolitus]|uniref:hypothetical protein n=1 Tax=Herbiconiux sp. SYSU D00978 TaxID=2812562 RepID=UPI001A9661D8|nr:hypothetical protein [Herbiconiux sp. SYSU D00978]
MLKRDPRSVLWTDLDLTSRARVLVAFLRRVEEVLDSDLEWLLYRFGSVEALAEYVQAAWPERIDDPPAGLVYTIEQVAIRQEVQPSTIRRRIQRGKLLAFQHERRWVMPAAQFDDRTWPSEYYPLVRAEAGMDGAPPLELALWLNRVDPRTGIRPADRIAQLERENLSTRMPLSWEFRIVHPPWGEDTPEWMAERKALKLARNLRQAMEGRTWYELEREAQLPLGTVLGVWALSPKIDLTVVAKLERVLNRRLWPTDEEIALDRSDQDADREDEGA